MSQLPATPELTQADFEAIESAVLETVRGRWFLAEYARRNRQADTTLLMTALRRIEDFLHTERPPQPVDKIRVDLLDMAKAIARTKAEIASIKPDVEHQGKIGDATEELDSIVAATETATSDILACAERLQEIAWTLREQGLDGEICDLIDAKSTDIYTACSFQDLTGQRTRKVIQVMRYLEGRINAMIEIWGLEGAMAAEAAEAESARRHDVALLNGPARPGEGLDQSDVDMVMGPAEVVKSSRPDTPLTPTLVIEHTPAEAAAPVADASSELSIDEDIFVSDELAIVSDTVTANTATADKVIADEVTPEVESASVAPDAPVESASMDDEAAAPEQATETSPRKSERREADPLERVSFLSEGEKLAVFS